MKDIADYPVPLDLGGETVQSGWIDYNGHMNVAFYVLAFDHAVDRLFDIIGTGPAYVEREQCSLFVLESHVTYQQELVEGEPMRFTGLILDSDEKRLHGFLEMYHAEKGFLAATYEFLALHVDSRERRSTPMPEAQRARLTALRDRHANADRPPAVGSRIGIRRRA